VRGALQAAGACIIVPLNIADAPPHPCPLPHLRGGEGVVGWCVLPPFTLRGLDPRILFVAGEKDPRVEPGGGEWMEDAA